MKKKAENLRVIFRRPFCLRHWSHMLYLCTILTFLVMGPRCSIPWFYVQVSLLKIKVLVYKQLDIIRTGNNLQRSHHHRLRFGHLGTRCENWTAKGRDVSVAYKLNIYVMLFVAWFLYFTYLILIFVIRALLSRDVHTVYTHPHNY